MKSFWHVWRRSVFLLEIPVYKTVLQATAIEASQDSRMHGVSSRMLLHPLSLLSTL
jgi:hypothetical protein